jgi:leucyl aminopeptidase
MNFELKKLDLEAAAIEKCDLLVLLVPEEFKPGRMRCRPWWRRRQAGDFAPRLASTWCYGPGSGCTRGVARNG